MVTPSEPQNSIVEQQGIHTRLPGSMTLLRAAWKRYRSRSGRLFLLLLVPLLPWVISYVGSIVSLLVTRTAFENLNIDPNAEWNTAINILLWTIGALVSFWVTFAAYQIVIADEKLSLFRALRSISRKQYFLGLWIVVLVNAVFLGAFALFIIPAVVLWVALLFPLVVFFAENRKGLDALARSGQLVKGYWWQIIGRTILFGIISWILPLALLFGLTFGFAFYGTTNLLLSTLILTIGPQIIFVLYASYIAGPLGLTWFYILYRELAQKLPAQDYLPSAQKRNIYLLLAVLGGTATVLLMGYALFFAPPPTLEQEGIDPGTFINDKPVATMDEMGIVDIGETPQTRDLKRESDLKSLQLALELYHSRYGNYPVALQLTRSTSEFISALGLLRIDGTIGAIPLDPKSDEDWYYGYESDGQQYRLTARLEEPYDRSVQCDPAVVDICIFAVASAFGISEPAVIPE